MSVTIKDISLDTSLSVATISKYLNGKPISEKNAEIIKASIQKLHYIPNQRARSLRTNKSYTVAIILPIISDYFWGTLCETISIFFQKYGYSTVIVSHSSIDFSSSIINKRVDGILLIAQGENTARLLQGFSTWDIPIVYIDQYIETPRSDFFTTNNYKSAYDATCRFLSCGHRKLCCLGTTETLYTYKERYRGFRDACSDYKIPASDFFQIDSSYNIPGGQQATQKLLSLIKNEHLTAVLSISGTAIDVLPFLYKNGIRIPEDLSFITFDEMPAMEATNLQVSRIRQNLNEIGLEASRTLLRRMKNDWSDFPLTRYISSDYVDKYSVRPISAV